MAGKTPTAKSPTAADSKSPTSSGSGGAFANVNLMGSSMMSPGGGMAKSQSFEFESSPPASLDVDVDEQEMAKVLKNPPAEARTEPAWKAYVDIGYISAADVNVWTEFSACAADDLEAHLQERGSNIVQAFLKMLANIHSTEARKYILTVLDQCCITNKRRWGALFNSHLRPKETEIASPLYKESAKEKEKEINSILYTEKEKAAAAAATANRKGSVLKIEEKRLNPYSPFFLIMRQETLDAFTQARVLHILATFFVHGATVPRAGSGMTGAQVAAESEELKEFVRYLILKLSATPAQQQAKPREMMLVLMTTKELLKNPDVRRLFVEMQGLKALENHFRSEHETRNTQYTYVAAFCVWLISYNKDLLSELKGWGLVQRLNKIITTTNREKVLRLCFAILVNACKAGGSGDNGSGAAVTSFTEEMISCGLIKFIDAMGGRKIKDDDLIKDIDEVRRALEEAMMALSSFEKYAAEVDSGKLQWSPVHVEQFWREHNQKFEAESFSYIKKVIALLETAQDELTLTVACSDLGEFARFHPDGKRIITANDGKKKLMFLMSGGTAAKPVAPKVTSAALLAVQKLMVNNWEHLAPSKSKGKDKDDA